MHVKEGMDRLIDGGDSGALLAAARDRRKGTKLQNRIISRLYATKAEKKWRAVAALGVVTAEGGFGGGKVRRLMQRFLWAMSEESGAVPHGIPEGIGAVLGSRPELRAEYVPILISHVVDEELYQSGPVLAGVLWALGTIGIELPAERERALPGITAALADEHAGVRSMAVWALSRLRLAERARESIAALEGDNAPVEFLADGTVRKATTAELAREALQASR